MIGVDSARSGERLSVALLAYAVALAVFLLVPPFFSAPVGPPEKFTLQEASDLLTPLLAIPLAWWICTLAGGLGRAGSVLFLLAAVVWVEAHGLHLAANAISDAFPEAEREAFYATPPGDLAHWLDEELSHWLWHGAWLAISAIMLWAATQAGPPVERRSGVSLLAGAAGAVHGATFFIVTVEGLTTLVGIPGTVALLALSGFAAVRGRLGGPVVTFFLVSTIVTLLGYLGWAAINDWTLPELTTELDLPL